MGIGALWKQLVVLWRIAIVSQLPAFETSTELSHSVLILSPRQVPPPAGRPHSPVNEVFHDLMRWMFDRRRPISLAVAAASVFAGGLGRLRTRQFPGVMKCPADCWTISLNLTAGIKALRLNNQPKRCHRCFCCWIH